MATKSGGELDLHKPELTDDHKVTIGTHLPENFQKIDDVFSDHVKDVSQGEAHGLRLVDGWLEFFGQKLKGGGGVPVGNVFDLAAAVDDKSVTLTWRDPDNLVVEDINGVHVTLSRWQGTKIVRKQGSYPEHENDGVLVVDNTERGKYETVGYTDIGLQNDVEYYYMAFPYTTDGVVTIDSVNRVTATPVVLDPATWKGIQAIVRAGRANEFFAVGDEIASEYNGKEITWVVIGIDVDTPAGGLAHSLTLQTKDCLHNIQFDAPEPSNPESNRKDYGNNRYIHSALRQWLNSSDAEFVWTSQHQYDAPPTDSLDLYNGAGFLHWLDPELVTVLGEVVKKVARNTVTDNGGQDVFADKVFLLSRVEVGLGAEGDTDGEVVYPYYVGIGDAGRIKNFDGSARPWWLRAPRIGSSYNVRYVNASGTVSYNHAWSTYGLAPACCIV